MAEGKHHFAICQMRPDGGSGVEGIVMMKQTEGHKVRIHVNIKGLTPGQHGFHIHQWGKHLFTFNLFVQATLPKDARLLALTSTLMERPTVALARRSVTSATSAMCMPTSMATLSASWKMS